MSARRTAALTLVAMICAAWIATGTEGVGAAFEMGASARALGIGGAYLALADDETAALHNPSALGSLEEIGFSSMFVRQFGGVTYGSLTVAIPWIGVNVSFVDSGEIASLQGSFRYASQAVTLSGGIPLGPVGLGARWQYVRASSPTVGNGWSLSPAVRVDLGSLRIAALLESALSGAMSYETGAQEDFEPALRLGVAAVLSPSPDVWWNAAFEVSGIFTDAIAFGGGLEAWIGGLGARVGYDGWGPTFGLTARVSSLQVDWAYAVRPDLGSSHRVSFSLRLK